MSNRPPFAVSLKPDFAGAASANVRSYWRAITSIAIAHQSVNDVSALQVAQTFWKDDAGVSLFTRAAVNPADTATTGWAKELAQTQIGAFLSGIAPDSAAARLFLECPRVELDHINAVSLPAMPPANAPTGAWVAEGAPIPGVQGSFGSVSCGPQKKLALITGLSEQLDNASNAEQNLRIAISENAARTLDKYVFDNVASSTSRPAGLLYNVTPIAATAGGGQAACIADLKNLVSAIVTAGGGANIQFFCNPAQAVVIAAFFPLSKLPVIPTTAVNYGEVIAVEVNGIASGYSGAPEILTSTEAEVHWDTSPQEIVTSPGVVAVPVRSGWQQRHKLLKMILRCAWCVRGTGLVQTISSTTW